MPAHLGSRWCDVQSLMRSFRGLHSLRLSCKSQLRIRMDFGASTSQAPPPPLPPPQEHHQQVGMDSARSLKQQHDEDDRDIRDWVDEEHLGDEN
ncbi:hypothetical protein Scep_014626 [Stephania cephalantha]|uniref:Uncharacterized protein n=1 Tax=Stephania cephalantha TaxID=152367 RepID=A0AAP0J2C7_9MAGN